MTSIKDIASLLDATSLILLIATIIVFFLPIFILFPPVPVDKSDALRQTHYKVGVHPKQSNLQHQRSPDLHRAKPGQRGKIQSLHIYPIKSCKGIELTESKVVAKGLDLDRIFCFAQYKASRVPVPGSETGELQTVHGWEVLTLRNLGLMANVHVDLWLPDPSKKSRQLGYVEGGFLIVRFPWTDGGISGCMHTITTKISHGLAAIPHKEFLLPLEFPEDDEIKMRGYHYDDAKFFGTKLRALNISTEVPRELATYLGASNKLGLFRMDPKLQREVYDCAPKAEDIGYQPVIDFQDQYPLHMTNLSSLHDLQTNIQTDQDIEYLDARRFRPNIILSGLPAWDEDDWRNIQFRNASESNNLGPAFDVSSRTVRCKLPNVDPNTGIRHKIEPDRTLRKHRDIDAGAPKKGCFGMQLCPLLKESQNLETKLRVGMEVHVIERGSHRAL